MKIFVKTFCDMGTENMATPTNSEAYTESMSRGSDGRRVIQQWCGGVIQAVVDRDRVLSNLFIRM